MLNMIRQLILAFGLASVTVMMHAAGTGYLVLRTPRIWSGDAEYQDDSVTAAPGSQRSGD